MTGYKSREELEDDRRWWMELAACRGPEVHVKMFFLSTMTKQDIDAIKSLCSSCPVREQCLNYAIDCHIDHGWWGGVSERARRRIRRARQRARS